MEKKHPSKPTITNMPAKKTNPVSKDKKAGPQDPKPKKDWDEDDELDTLSSKRSMNQDEDPDFEDVKDTDDSFDNNEMRMMKNLWMMTAKTLMMIENKDYLPKTNLI